MRKSSGSYCKLDVRSVRLQTGRSFTLIHILLDNFIESISHANAQTREGDSVHSVF